MLEKRSHAMPWQSEIAVLDGGRTRQVTVREDGSPLPYAAIIERWQESADFRDFWIAQLADAPYDACFWETPPITRATASRVFEFVLTDSPALAGVRANPAAFAEQFDAAGAEAAVTTFRNLGGDAVLVAPCPDGAHRAYPHLTAFSQTAPVPQQHALWRDVGAAVAEHLTARPLWLSTSGLGVPWLHVRLDSRPKYYTYRPYREMA